MASGGKNYAMPTYEGSNNRSARCHGLLLEVAHSSFGDRFKFSCPLNIVPLVPVSVDVLKERDGMVSTHVYPLAHIAAAWLAFLSIDISYLVVLYLEVNVQYLSSLFLAFFH